MTAAAPTHLSRRHREFAVHSEWRERSKFRGAAVDLFYEGADYL